MGSIPGGSTLQYMFSKPAMYVLGGKLVQFILGLIVENKM